MYRRILITIVLISPLLIVFIGFPVIPQDKTEGNFALSKRCFVVGQLTQFLSCYVTNERISGLTLLLQIHASLESIHTGLGIAAFLFVSLQLITLPFLLPHLLYEEK